MKNSSTFAPLFQKRIKALRNALAVHGESAAAIISSNPLVQKSADTHYAPRANSSLYYFTGEELSDALLIVTTKSAEPHLIVRKLTKSEIVWNGAQPSSAPLAKQIGAKLTVISDPARAAVEVLKSTHTIFYEQITASLGEQAIKLLTDKPTALSAYAPKVVADLNVLTAPLRERKSKEEVALIRHAAQISANSFHELLPLIESGVSERALAIALEFSILLQEGTVAFDTIIGAGPSAATLHYTSHKRKLKAGEMVLIDFGAAYKLYASDITRTIPISGEFTPQQRKLYDLVRKTQHAVFGKIKAGVKYKELQDTAIETITEGLCALKVLKGSVKKLIAAGAYKPYYPHGIGHSLGLDVHDISTLRSTKDAVLQEGMVLTVEPGLYFQKKTGPIMPCGIRIEDDVLVTKKGCTLLTPEIPTDPDALEDLMAQRDL